MAKPIHEDTVPVRDAVRAACELLGYDPLYVADEGKLVAVVAAGAAKSIVKRMRHDPYGHEDAVIGEVLEGPAGRVTLVTKVGGTRVVDVLSGEMLLRIR